jgi:alpha-1,3-mannosylglycoprotein beta-1,4-N-acetylglucosaminyltransferase A/B
MRFALDSLSTASKKDLASSTTLMKNELFSPKFIQSKSRSKVSIVIGIPTIKREKTSYLLETLKSLLDSMNDLEKSDILVVVLIAEIDDQNFIQNTIEQINKAYGIEVESGLFDIIVPPNEFYPDFSKIRRDKVFNDSAERVKWRTKQNYDFSYLMSYAQKRGNYYLQVRTYKK